MSNMSESNSFKDRLGVLIREGLQIRYTSKSSLQNIPTNNFYQTVKLGDELLGGFRSYRSGLFEKYNFEGQAVIDIGANLGENSRLAASQGARIVYSVEYDELFSLISSLICAYNKNSSVVCINADATTYNYDQHAVDVALVFSVWPYVQDRLVDIKSAGAKVLVLETHNVESIEKVSIYLGGLARLYPHYSIVECVDWGGGLDGVRYVVNFCEKWSDLSKVYALTRRWTDYSGLFGYKSADHLRNGAQLSKDEESAISGGAGDPLYWKKFVRGANQYKESKDVDWGNVYFQELKYQLKNTSFDEDLAKLLDSDEKIMARVARRFDDFWAIARGGEADPIGVYVPKEKLKLGLARGDISPDLAKKQEGGKSWIDGHHRLYSYAHHGVAEIPTALLFHPHDIRKN